MSLSCFRNLKKEDAIEIWSSRHGTWVPKDNVIESDIIQILNYGGIFNNVFFDCEEVFTRFVIRVIKKNVRL